MEVRRVTSAFANKLLRKLDDEKDFILSNEYSSLTYECHDNEEERKSEHPDYSFEDACAELDRIDAQVRSIKHALNVFNTTTTLEGVDLTIDEALVKMAQLNRRKDRLHIMRLKRNRVKTSRRGIVADEEPEYIFLSYNIDDVKQRYEEIQQEIFELQNKIDYANQTLTFEITIY